MPIGKRERELILRIIDLAESVQERKVDPFEVDIEDFFKRLRETLSKSENLEEFLLDIRAVLGLSNVISHQEEWIKHRSSLLYFDPLLVLLKLRNLSNKQLARAITNSWHPIVEMECITPHAIKKSQEYWSNLLPLSERGVQLDVEEAAPGKMEMDELEEMGLKSREDFDRMLEDTWSELKEEAGEEGRISYWDFIDVEDYHGTVFRAWIVSFLVSYGYATLELEPLEERITLKPKGRPEIPPEEASTSVPISICRSDWERRRPQSA